MRSPATDDASGSTLIACVTMAGQFSTLHAPKNKT
jgi:hypothetical protein